MNNNKAIELFLKNFTGILNIDIINNFKQISKIVVLESKSILFTEGEKADYFYYIVEGNIKLSKITLDGKETIIRIINTNDIFAEAVLFGNMAYPVNAAAINKTILLAINIKGFQQLCAENQNFVLHLFVTMSHQLKYLVDMINDLSSSDTTKRLMKYLKSISDKKGSSVIKLPVPKRELAMLLGAAPETISRIFARLQNDGFILINGKEITILKDDIV